jgi:hypothetical protein
MYGNESGEVERLNFPQQGAFKRLQSVKSRDILIPGSRSSICAGHDSYELYLARLRPIR